MLNHEKKQRQELNKLLENTHYVAAYTTDTYNRIDGILIDWNTAQITHIIETKAYRYERPSTKYEDFQIDYDKLEALEEYSHKYNNAKPLLLCFFTNELVVWDISIIDWRKTKKWVMTNDKGINYGASKSKSPQAYLKLEDAIYRNNNIRLQL